MRLQVWRAGLSDLQKDSTRLIRSESEIEFQLIEICNLQLERRMLKTTIEVDFLQLFKNANKRRYVRR